MDDGIERVILTNEELLQATAAILDEQLSPLISPSTSPQTGTDIHSIRFCPDFLSPIHKEHFPVNHLPFNFDSLQDIATPDQPIDPRLQGDNCTTNQSSLNPNLLEPISSESQLQSDLASIELSSNHQRSAKRRKTNLKTNQNTHFHALDIPTCPAGLADIGTQQSLSVNDINAPVGDSEQSACRVNDKSNSLTNSEVDGLAKNDLNYQPNPQRPSSSISAMLHSGHPTSELSDAAQADSLFLLYEDPSSVSPAESNIHPLLQTIHSSEPTFPLHPTSLHFINRTNPHCVQIVPKPVEPPGKQVSELSTHPTSYLGNTHVDVHGPGAGGGAATVIAAAAAQQLSATTDHVSQKDMAVTPHLEEVQDDELGDSSREPLPTSYNPDQFRSCNRIHWTQEEEDLLQAEVELNWERYDCMAQIMKRHGPKGSVSKAFADRTAVSLKDKAVNISSRWYRDGTEVSVSRRRAFARFRPKQLRGKPRSELPGMSSLTDPSPPSSLDRHHPQHPPCSASSQ
ncbi:hypothetical protein PCANC_20882 [Puccinia coronata f. sp. avenae]|uniref:Myb-like domain-containing protein n=1 Tax=Puccinia coronata f. sp. avenae TaxID=200324 RepID=A0A2N5TWB4_9BASI|nr:hypothetical protein PCANC_20882 [Puccinia coronata f. sp. avenae]